MDNFDRSYTYSYSLSDSSQKTTSDYKYVVTPIGRLTSIPPKSSMSKSELTAVKEALEWKFGKKNVVKDIFLNARSGITIDCRR